MTIILTMMLMTNGDNILFKNDDIRCDDIKDDEYETGFMEKSLLNVMISGGFDAYCAQMKRSA